MLIPPTARARKSYAAPRRSFASRAELYQPAPARAGWVIGSKRQVEAVVLLERRFGGIHRRRRFQSLERPQQVGETNHQTRGGLQHARPHVVLVAHLLSHRLVLDA